MSKTKNVPRKREKQLHARETTTTTARRPKEKKGSREEKMCLGARHQRCRGLCEANGRDPFDRKRDCRSAAGKAGAGRPGGQGRGKVRRQVPEGGKGPAWAHPVVCGGRLYLRHGEFLYAFAIRAMAEAGLSNYAMDNWFGMLGPAGMPPDAITKLNKIANDWLASSEGAHRLGDMGARPIGGTPADLGSFVQGELTKWRPVIEPIAASLQGG